MITHVLPVYNRTPYPPQTRADFMSRTDLLAHLFPGYSGDISLPASDKEPSTYEVTFRMEHVSIKYGSRTILKELDWEVKKWREMGVIRSQWCRKINFIKFDLCR